MIITHVLRCMAPRMTGHVHSVPGLGAALCACGHDVRYWGAAHVTDRRDMGPPEPSVRVFDMRRPYSWFYSPALAAALGREIRAMDIFHIHGFWSHPNWAAVRIAGRAGVPCLLSPRGELSRWALCRTLIKRLKKGLFLRTLGRSTFRHVRCLHALSQAEAHDFRRAGYRGPVTIVPNGIDVECFTKLPDPARAEHLFPALRGRRVVLFLARIDPQKGLDELLYALASLAGRPTYDDVLLVVAGSGDDRGYVARIRALVDRLGLGGHVLLTGPVRMERKMSLLSRADLFVLSSRHEGFSMAVLEALASATPVLITPACSFPEVVECQAGLCRQAQREALAEGLVHLLELSCAQRRDMGFRGRRLVADRYTWSDQAARMLTVYRAMLEGRDIPQDPARDLTCVHDVGPDDQPSSISETSCQRS